MELAKLNKNYNNLVDKKSLVELLGENKIIDLVSYNIIYYETNQDKIQYNKDVKNIVTKIQMGKNVGEFKLYIPDIINGTDILIGSSRNGVLDFSKKELFTEYGLRYLELLSSCSYENNDLVSIGYTGVFCAPLSVKFGLKIENIKSCDKSVGLLFECVSVYYVNNDFIKSKYC